VVKRSVTTGSRLPSHRTPAGVLEVVLNCEIFSSSRLVRRPCRGAQAITTGGPVVALRFTTG
jgi:hypothetical protein